MTHASLFYITNTVNVFSHANICVFGSTCYNLFAQTALVLYPLPRSISLVRCMLYTLPRTASLVSMIFYLCSPPVNTYFPQGHFYIGVCPVSGVVVRFVETMLLPNVYTTKVFLVVYVSTFARRIWFKGMLGKSGTSLSHRTTHYCEQYGLFIVRVYNKKTLT